MSTIKKHSIVYGTVKSSISLEPAFLVGLKAEANERGISIGTLVYEIKLAMCARGDKNLSSAIRVHVLLRASGTARPSVPYSERVTAAQHAP